MSITSSHWMCIFFKITFLEVEPVLGIQGYETDKVPSLAFFTLSFISESFIFFIPLLKRIIMSILLPAVDVLQHFEVLLICRCESFDNISKILSWLISRHSSSNLPFPLLIFLCSVFRTLFLTH